MTDNYPKGRTFAQVGGGASGEIIIDTDYNRKISGVGSIALYTIEDVPYLIRRWANFYKNESCGYCVPCREGSFRLYDVVTNSKIDWKEVKSIINNMEKTSFCALGRSIALPYRGIIENFLEENDEIATTIPK